MSSRAELEAVSEGRVGATGMSACTPPFGAARSDKCASKMAEGAVSVRRKDPRLELESDSAISSTLDLAGRAVRGAIRSAILDRLEGLMGAVPGES